jgi:hypothetical protein
MPYPFRRVPHRMTRRLRDHSTCPAPDRFPPPSSRRPSIYHSGQVGILAIQLRSNHYCYLVHDLFSFEIVLSEKEKHSEFVAQSGNGSGNNSRPRCGFFSFVGKFELFEFLVAIPGFESTSCKETTESCGAAWPSKALKGKRRNS